MILYAFWMIKKVKLSDPGAFLGADVKIADESSDSIKIGLNMINWGRSPLRKALNLVLQL